MNELGKYVKAFATGYVISYLATSFLQSAADKPTQQEPAAPQKRDNEQGCFGPIKVPKG